MCCEPGRELRSHLDAAFWTVVELVPEAGRTLDQVASVAGAIGKRAGTEATRAWQSLRAATKVSKERRAVTLRLAAVVETPTPGLIFAPTIGVDVPFSGVIQIGRASCRGRV